MAAKVNNPMEQRVPEAEGALSALWKKGKPFQGIPSTRVVTERQILNYQERYPGEAAHALGMWARHRWPIIAGRYSAVYTSPYYAVIDLEMGEKSNPPVKRNYPQSRWWHAVADADGIKSVAYTAR